MLKRQLRPRMKLSLTTFTLAFTVIALVPLAIFMSDTPCLCRGVAIDTPKVSSAVSKPGALRWDALLVAVTRDGRTFFGSDAVSPDRLATKIQDGLKSGAERRVYIKADARAKVGAVNEALDGIRAAGIENIAFLVEQRRPVTSLPAAVGVAN